MKTSSFSCASTASSLRQRARLRRRRRPRLCPSATVRDPIPFLANLRYHRYARALSTDRVGGVANKPLVSTSHHVIRKRGKPLHPRIPSMPISRFLAALSLLAFLVPSSLLLGGSFVTFESGEVCPLALSP